MKRKDWKIKNLKEGIYGNIEKLKTKKKYIIRRRNFFLRKLFIRRNRFLSRKIYFPNYFFYKFMLSTFKKKKQNYFYKIFLKNNFNVSFYPEFSSAKNVFNKKVKAQNILLNNNIKYLFCKNKYKKNFGLNYYIIKKNKNLNYNDFSKFLNEDENKFLIHLKSFHEKTNLDPFFINNLNIYFNFNLYNMYIIEIYKINILLILNNINKN